MLLGAFRPPKPAPAARHGRLAMSGGCIYILGSHTGTLYIGVSSNLYLCVVLVTIKCVPQQILFSGLGG
jgi:hypothetical protein